MRSRVSSRRAVGPAIVTEQVATPVGVEAGTRDAGCAVDDAVGVDHDAAAADLGKHRGELFLGRGVEGEFHEFRLRQIFVCTPWAERPASPCRRRCSRAGGGCRRGPRSAAAFRIRSRRRRRSRALPRTARRAGSSPRSRARAIPAPAARSSETSAPARGWRRAKRLVAEHVVTVLAAHVAAGFERAQQAEQAGLRQLQPLAELGERQPFGLRCERLQDVHHAQRRARSGRALVVGDFGD